MDSNDRKTHGRAMVTTAAMKITITMALLTFGTAGCGAAVTSTDGAIRRFPLRDPLWVDNDGIPFNAPCSPDPKKPKHKVCAPAEYVSPFVWDGVDAMVFRPVSRFLAIDPAGESVDVNALDEVPDSSWFQNRIGIRHRSMTPDEVALGSCDEETLDTEGPDGSWLIDKGKENGANPGFRVKTPHGTFLVKADEKGKPERATGATSIATRIYHAAGYWAGCDRVVYIRRSLLKLKEGLAYSDNTGVTRPFAEKQLEVILSNAAKRGDRYRMVASKWLDGKTIGPFQYEGVRKDDPNDAIPHEDRRELRGQRVLAAWLAHFDAREQNSMSTWMAQNDTDPDSSPGHIVHWIIDLNDCFGSEWEWEQITRRLNHSYYFDGGDVARDYITLGIPQRPWDKTHRSTEVGGDIFGYFSADPFKPEDWKPGYQNPAFLRMTERDAAWMTRILARLTSEHVERLVRVGDFSEPKSVAYLTATLLERQRKILQRYFSRVSPITDLEVNGTSLCGVDLARKSSTAQASSALAPFDPRAFRYASTIITGSSFEHRTSAIVTPLEDGRLCVPLPRVAASDGGSGGKTGARERDDAPSRYIVVEIANGVAEHPVRAHLYDLGPSRGHRLVGVER